MRHWLVLFDHLVGKLLQLRWHIKAECRGGLEVDHQIEPLRALYRQIAWLGTVQDFRDVIPVSSEYLAYVRPVSNETAGPWKLSEQGNEGEPLGYRKLADLLRRDEHEGRRQQDTGINMLYPGGLQGTLEVIRDLHFYNFSFERERPCHRLRGCELSRVEFRDANDCYTREPGNDLFEKPHQFSAQLREIKKHSRHIAARARNTLDVPFRNRIAFQI